jgi:hypothetical protein
VVIFFEKKLAGELFGWNNNSPGEKNVIFFDQKKLFSKQYLVRKNVGREKL